jgi:hypothetical protein
MNDRFKARFIHRFGNAVVKVAKKHDWSPTTRQQAHEYIKALVEGDASVPKGLRGKPLEAIRRRFATTCVMMNADPERFPGMLEDWYDECEVSAIDYLARPRPQLQPA